jgi:hypothetical protein
VKGDDYVSPILLESLKEYGFLLFQFCFFYVFVASLFVLKMYHIIDEYVEK